MVALFWISDRLQSKFSHHGYGRPLSKYCRRKPCNIAKAYSTNTAKHNKFRRDKNIWLNCWSSTNISTSPLISLVGFRIVEKLQFSPFLFAVVHCDAEFEHSSLNSFFCFVVYVVQKGNTRKSNRFAFGCNRKMCCDGKLRKRGFVNTSPGVIWVEWWMEKLALYIAVWSHFFLNSQVRIKLIDTIF